VALRDIGDWLLDQAVFQQQADMVEIDAACSELGENFTRRSEHQDFVHDWDHLLLAASALSQSRKGASQAVALRIAQTCLSQESVSETQRDSAALTLDALANHPSIKLAEQRNLLRPSFDSRIPGVARLDHFRRRFEQSITESNGNALRVNRFQRRLWDEVRNRTWMSVSAPTSAGKSFILARWVCELMRSMDEAAIVYLVPTRALISQVERDLRDLFSHEGLDEISVSALPILRAEEATEAVRKRVFVFTQERLHILMSANPDLSVQALIVDEAHKVGDRQRGVLLQDVIERLTVSNPELRVLFASPMTSNPEVLLADAPSTLVTAAFTSEDVTVTQNIYRVAQRPHKPKIWDVSINLRGKDITLGEIELDSKPNNDSKRLSFVAHAISANTHGNIIYVNGAAEAEKIASQLFDLIGSDVEGEARKDLDSLIELVQHIVHRKYSLATCLRRGVAFHYGNIPLLIREEIERLFSTGTIKYLVCTSTLIEGVNMACRNIFMRGPKKGIGHPLSSEDFWNLAGRAGRWGKEFQGNIFCIDPDWTNLWGEDGPPRERTRQPIRRTTDDVLSSPADLVSFIQDDAPVGTLRTRPELEYVFSYLAGVHVRHGGLLKAPWASRFSQRDLTPLARSIRNAVSSLDIDPSIINRNPGISPFALNGLLEYFRERQGDVDELLPVDPASEDAAQAYAAIFGRLCRRACPKLGPEGGRPFMLAMLVTRWMRGFPLSRLINERIDYIKRKSQSPDEATEIRSVMNDVEQIARFEAPRGLNCYCDVLQQYLTEIGREDLLENLPQFNIFLELGVSQQTQISLIGIGLSRTSTIAVSELITADSYTEPQVIHWLTENKEIWQNFTLPALVKKEIERVLSQHGVET